MTQAAALPCGALALAAVSTLADARWQMHAGRCTTSLRHSITEAGVKRVKSEIGRVKTCKEWGTSRSSILRCSGTSVRRSKFRYGSPPNWCFVSACARKARHSEGWAIRTQLPRLYVGRPVKGEVWLPANWVPRVRLCRSAQISHPPVFSYVCCSVLTCTCKPAVFGCQQVANEGELQGPEQVMEKTRHSQASVHCSKSAASWLLLRRGLTPLTPPVATVRGSA